MFEINQISRAGNYLIRYAIGIIESKFPEPPSDSADPYYVDIITELRKREIGDLIKQMDSIQKIESHGVVAVGKIQENETLKEDYYAYLTSRIHFFADDWMGENNQSDEQYYDEVEKDSEGSYEVNYFMNGKNENLRGFLLKAEKNLSNL
jgi:hypothetical protein